MSNLIKDCQKQNYYTGTVHTHAHTTLTQLLHNICTHNTTHTQNTDAQATHTVITQHT